MGAFAFTPMTSPQNTLRPAFGHRLPVTLVYLFSVIILGFGQGCASVSQWSCPAERLSFPARPLKVTAEGRFYDVKGTGRSDFAILRDETGRLNVLAYDDDGDGVFDRRYRLSDYSGGEVPHLIVLIDSLPYRLVAERYQAGEWQWFYPPQKVIPPFPSMSVLTFGEILHCPPAPGFFEHYYDRREQVFHNQNMDQVFGYHGPWHLQLDYVAPYWMVGMMYLNPRSWYAYELWSLKHAFDNSPSNITVVYAGASSGMLSRYGRQGAAETLDLIDQFCMQILYERRGAVKISFMSDHGHNLCASRNTLVDDTLLAAGFHPCSGPLQSPQDVIIELDGLVTCFGIHTQRPKAVADVLLHQRPEIQMALYPEGDQVIIRDLLGAAAIDRRGSRFRYRALDRDVLNYGPVLASLAAGGKVDAEGFVADRDWLGATADHEYPDVPHRAWDAFHGLAVNAPDVEFVLKDGYCAGAKFWAGFIDMKSTHGGLNQVNSDAVVLTMIRPLPGPLRSRELLPLIEPRYIPGLPPRMDRK
jgi:hypothetical protein